MKTRTMKTRSPVLLSTFIFTLLAGMSAHAEASKDTSSLVFEDVWIAEAPPVSKVLAAYMTINNTGDTDQKLVSAKSADFSSIEFHRTVDKKGMASMQHQDYLMVPAGSSLILKPGDYHMMLFNPARKLRAGDKSSFQFQLDDGSSIDTTAIVKKAGAEDSHQHHHH